MDKHVRPTIAIMLGDTQSSYSEELLRGFYNCSRELDVNLVFLMGPQMPQYCKNILTCNFDGDYNYQFDTIYNYVHFTRPDALIITYGSLSIFNNNHDREAFLSQYRNIPFLVLEDTPEDPSIPYLIADNYNGMYQCVEHLARDHGYRKIVFLGGPANNRDSNERLAAYRDVMAKYGLTVCPDMIVYGNYSELVTEQVEYLLDHNPGVEAIVCANDNMAKTCYRVCARRNLLVGHDVAITGFDDIESAQTMEPPLTSVSHSSFQFSRMALQNALRLCNGEPVSSSRMSSHFCRRSSCGCPSSRQLSQLQQITLEDIPAYIEDQITQIGEELVSSETHREESAGFQQCLRNYFDCICQCFRIESIAEFSFDLLLRQLKKLTAYPAVSGGLLLEHLSSVMHTLIASAEQPHIRGMLSQCLTFTMQNVYSSELSSLQSQMKEYNRQAWFVPSFTRDLLVSDMDLEEIMLQVMKRLKLMHARSSYFYLFREPIIHKGHSAPLFPEEIYLTAYHNETEMYYYKESQRPVITTANGFSSLFAPDASRCYTAFILFSGEEQYGLLLCELDQKDISFMQICSLSVGTIFRFIQLNNLEKSLRKELQDSLQAIQQQNNILSFISEYDDLSQHLNRRGFMQHAGKLLEQNVGRQAYLLFGDLDHLKEINDCFGHLDGDFAIRVVSDRLRCCLPPDAITARLGGDEFVSLILSDDPTLADRIRQTIKKAGDAFNAASQKPYYVDISVGLYEFTCSPQINLPDLLRQSDAILYKEKSKRRKSIKKESPVQQ